MTAQKKYQTKGLQKNRPVNKYSFPFFCKVLDKKENLFKKKLLYDELRNNDSLYHVRKA